MTRRERIACSATTMAAAPFIGIMIDQLIKKGQPISVGGMVILGLETFASTTLLGSLGESAAAGASEVSQTQD